MADEKKGPNDGSYKDDRYADDADISNEEKKTQESLAKDKKFNEEMKALEETRKEVDERKKEELKRFKKEDKNRKEIRKKKTVKIGGEKVNEAKIFKHKRGMGIFIRNKTKPQKIRKALKKVHGLSADEKKLFPDIVAAYSPTAITIKKDKLKTLFRELRHIKSGRRGGTDFQKLKKAFDKDFLKKNFGGKKRKLAKIERAFFGEKDPLKHEIKQSSNRNPGAGKTGSNSSRVRVGKRF